MRAPKRKARIVETGQLSFFDPDGTLLDLRAEAQQLTTTIEHCAFLEEGRRRAEAALATLHDDGDQGAKQALEQNRNELAKFERQLQLTSPNIKRLDAVNAAIEDILSDDRPFVQNTEAENGRETTSTGRGQFRGRTPDLPDTSTHQGIRSPGQGGRVARASGIDRAASGRLLRDADHPDESARNGDRRFDELRADVKHSVGVDTGGHRPRLSDEEANWRRERARQNYQIADDAPIGTGTPKQKVAANIEAIRILKTLSEEQRAATEAEKQRLVSYTGWGAFAQAIFDANPRSRNAEIWKSERQLLADLVTTDEWEAARASTLNAHYTSVPVIRGMWRALEHLGFTGGRVIEPAAGVGHFIGLTPERLRDEIAWTGVELDPLTGGIAKALYPGADIRVQGFETTTWPDGFFDLAISNVPFGDYTVRDTRYRPMSIHDYFFVRSLDKVRPGGLVAFITSRYSLDKETDLARREIAKRADFLGAIRLPGGTDGAFAKNAGTAVTTDIIFLQRRAKGQTEGNDQWLSLREIQTPDGPVRINSYFAENPQMMLGDMRLTRSMFSATDPVLIGPTDHLDEHIAQAAQKLAANTFVPRGHTTAHAVKLPAIDTETDGIREGAFYVKDDQIYRNVSGVGVVQTLSRIEADKVKCLIAMRDIVTTLLARQASGDGEDRGPLRDQLNQIYDAFYRRYGAINKTVSTVSTRLRTDGTPVVLRRFPNVASFRDDPDAFKVAAIETYNENKDIAAKAAIFSHDIVQPYVEPVISGPSDALAVSLNQCGNVDIPLIASKLGMSEAAAIEVLGERIWLDPAGDIWRTAEDYLSGDVVGKLADARAAAEADPRYERNAVALEEVQPTPLTRVDIKVLFGAPWVPLEDYHTFFADVLNVPLPEDALRLNPLTKKWQFVAKPTIADSVTARFGTSRSSALQVFEAALNNAEIRVMDTTADDTLIYNPQASEESNAKVAQVRELFSGAPETGIDGWIWEDDARAERLEALYNAKFNRLVPTRFDGSHQAMPGIVRYVTTHDGQIEPFRFHAHQLNVIWRVVSNGNTLIDHAVGAGKTFSMIAAGMEQKRLGLIQRPMYVVPNHMLEQFSRELLQLYPGAKILVADKEAMSQAKRQEFAARIAAERWDGIIITHDAFGRIRMSDEAYERHIRGELEELDTFKMRAASEDGKDSPTVKELEKARKRLEARLDKVLNKERKDEGVTFEELAVDFLFVDEAHAFKNLGFRTRHTRVKGLAATESQRATDMFLKIQYLEEKRPGRSVVFATGTPVSNTIAEMYTMQRYLQMPLLRSYGINEFDAWAATFGDIVTQVELAPSGKGFRTTRSFSKFVNIPELMALYACVADTQTAEMLNLPRPKLKGGAVQIVEAEMSERESAMMQSLVERAEAIKGKRAEKGGDNMLKIMSDGLKLATDIRLIDPDATPNPEGKIAKAVENITRIWKAGEDPALCQMVFLDMGVPRSQAKARTNGADMADDEGAETDNPLFAGVFNLYEDLRGQLMAKGIPRHEIAFIHDADNDLKKARLFAAVREGDIRILIGSTAKMGVGTNVQKHLIAMHHLDAPWRPADVEQRDGRILRQGNLNPEVEIFRYITLGSLDAYRWQTLNTKANFIAQLRAGARGVRTAEDIDSPLPEAAMIKAAATGDPRIMEHAELSKEVQLLEAARRAHERSISAARHARFHTLAKIEKLQTQAIQAQADCSQIVDLGGERFAMVLNLGGERTVRERRVAGEAIRTRLLRVGARHWDEVGLREVVGELSGFRAAFTLRRRAGELQVATVVEGRLAYARGDYFTITAETDPVGLIRRFETLIKSIPQFLAETETERAKAEMDLPRLERQLGCGPFPKLAHLEAAKARITALEEQLQPKEQERSATMHAARPEDEWNKLDADTKTALEAVIMAAEIGGQYTTQGYRLGDVYAYPVEGGIAWGVKGGDEGSEIARGVKTKAREHVCTAERDDRNEKSQTNGHVGGHVNETVQETYDRTHVISLRKAGVDEQRFDNAFRTLVTDLAVDLNALLAIANAYTGGDGGWTTREEALGAIEIHFYQQRASTQNLANPVPTKSI